MSDKRQALYLIDGSSYIFRAFYAMIRTPLTTSAGIPVGAVYGFTNMLLKIIRDKQPPLLGVAFDPPGKSFRNELLPTYKANRTSPPDDLKAQIPLVHEMVEAFGIPTLMVKGFEADDVLGTVAVRAVNDGYDVVLVTGDKDFNQLVTDNLKIWDDRKNLLIGPAEVKERYGGVGPEGVLDIMCLCGDTADNVPGVPGIGEKTASKLIAEFGDLEGIYADLSKVKGAKKQEKLAEHKEQIFANRELIRIRTDVEIPTDYGDLKTTEPDPEQVRPLFEKYEFRSLLGEVKAEPKEVLSREGYRTILTLDELEALAAQIREKKRFAFDLETTSLDPLDAQIVGFALCAEPGVGVYVPVGHVGEHLPEQPSVDAVLEVVGPLLQDPEIEVVGQNLKYDYSVLRARFGMEIARIGFDTMLASYLVNPSRRGHSMDALAQELLGHACIAYTEVAGKGKDQVGFEAVPLRAASEYAAEDADITLRLADILAPQIKDAELGRLMEDVELPLVKVLARMELAGMKIDTGMLASFGEELGAMGEKLVARCHELAGQEFNVASPKQLREILFEKMGLPVQKRTKSGPSTDAEVLGRLAGMGYELPEAILEYRHAIKLKSTYVDALPKLVSPVDGRVHSDFNQAVAATGRLSSNNPNLQNIPIRTELGRRIRQAFVPEDGHVLMSADYSQIELRILAHLSGDEGLLEAFRSGSDVHAFTASRVFDVPLEEVGSDLRRRAKAINFGVVYGQSAFRLGQTLDIPTKEAARFIEDYFERYAGVKTFLDKVVEGARETGDVRTILGRRRFVPEIHSKNGSLRQAAERVAINTPVQGSAADLIKLAMISVDEWLASSGLKSRLILQVHDELVLEVPEAEIGAAGEGLVRCMSEVMDLDVPLKVDMSSGANWDEAH